MNPELSLSTACLRSGKWARWPAIVTVALLALSLPAAADFAGGLQAYDAGDYARALEEWRTAAGKGDIDAMVGLAGLHASGFGVRQNYASAAQWYEKAARRGHASAQLNLGDAYARGRGVKRDLIAGHMWLSLAAGQGKIWAAQRRDQLEKSMTPTQIASAQARASAFRLVK
ncbi:MAG: tetratricopeptide repeat protein [Alphaproteobacteria bacterium]|nr:tetratricopeptide repeat protein [Alphaproteobacteria bacterium]